MTPHWAEENLRVIRTLMERAAVYRRALAPIMLLVGALGLLAALAGWRFQLNRGPCFVAYWHGIGFVALCSAFLLARRQALRAREPFWSSPTQRVVQALLPAIFVGWALGSAAAWGDLGNLLPTLIWIMVYGCGLNAAGFFMPRGIKLLGWLFLIGGALLMAYLLVHSPRWPVSAPHFIMGAFFGGLHLAYGVYLHFTEKEPNET